MPDRPPRTKFEKQEAVHEVMSEYKGGELHSGSKDGPQVTNPKQAKAIAMSESGQAKPKRDGHHRLSGNPSAHRIGRK